MEVASVEALNQHLENNDRALSIIYFWAAFHEACKPGGQMDQVIAALEKKFSSKVSFYKVNAEKFSGLAGKYGITMVPTFVLLKGITKIDALEGAKPQELSNKIETCLQNFQSSMSASDSTKSDILTKELQERLDSLINSAKYMLFMKGTADDPKCKFSRAMIELLNSEDIPFATFNVLNDNLVREGLKQYKTWSTYPQLYVCGKLVGGLDKVKEFQTKGPLKEVLQSFAPAKSTPGLESSGNIDTKLNTLINQAPVMLFMKGSPDEPKCGFSRKMVELLRKSGIPFGSFDILTDNIVREELKRYSNWPTYPQLYSKGKLIGGLDIVEEMAEEGDLEEQLGVENLEKKLKGLIMKGRIMLFMKGSPDAPRCGFSRSIVQVLRDESVKFEYFDILTDETVRQGLKQFSKWPTYPQLYSNGKLIGGLDIVRELHEEGELKSALN